MDFYGIFKFLHIVAATIWVGGGFAMILAATLAERRGGAAEVNRVTASLGNVMFMPASLATLIFGIVLTAMAWSFADLWIIIALVGIAVSLAIGILIIKPTAEKIDAIVASEGPTSPRVAAMAANLMRKSRFDYVVLFVVVADMVFKPGWGDWPVLLAMVVALAVGAYLFLFQPQARVATA
jgi:uncharacterized membrane protein